ncbi:MAG: ATP-binding cassette domain-containing protein [Solirubrobacterales bacterium]|nr:ATP-binding cassette domain-containing protein [Solirubrobacterales bacterium]
MVVEHLSKRFGDRVAFDDVSFEVGYGEVFGFLGPNGAGKTTTVRTLGTLIAPTLGSATVAGVPLSAANGPAIRARISIMPGRSRSRSTAGASAPSSGIKPSSCRWNPAGTRSSSRLVAVLAARRHSMSPTRNRSASAATERCCGRGTSPRSSCRAWRFHFGATTTPAGEANDRRPPFPGSLR